MTLAEKTICVPSRRSALRAALAIALSAGVALAACSSNSTVTLTSDPVADDAQTDGTDADTAPAATPTPTPTAVVVDEPEGSADTPDPPDEPADDGSGTGDGTDGDGSDTPSFVGGDSGNFCEIAHQLDENNPFENEALPPFSEAFFVEVFAFYEAVQTIAPDEIAPDIAAIQAGLTQLAQIAERYDYNLLDPGFGAELEAVDTTGLDVAGDRLEAYLLTVCGLDISGSDSDSSSSAGSADPDPADDAALRAINELILSGFDIDDELAACLLDNIEDLTAALADPAVLNEEVCGTTLLNVLSGLG